MAKTNIDKKLDIVEDQIDELKRKLRLNKNKGSSKSESRAKIEKQLETAKTKKTELNEASRSLEKKNKPINKWKWITIWSLVAFVVSCALFIVGLVFIGIDKDAGQFTLIGWIIFGTMVPIMLASAILSGYGGAKYKVLKNTKK